MDVAPNKTKLMVENVIESRVEVEIIHSLVAMTSTAHAQN